MTCSFGECQVWFLEAVELLLPPHPPRRLIDPLRKAGSSHRSYSIQILACLVAKFARPTLVLVEYSRGVRKGMEYSTLTRCGQARWPHCTQDSRLVALGGIRNCRRLGRVMIDEQQAGRLNGEKSRPIQGARRGGGGKMGGWQGASVAGLVRYGTMRAHTFTHAAHQGRPRRNVFCCCCCFFRGDRC